MDKRKILIFVISMFWAISLNIKIYAQEDAYNSIVEKTLDAWEIQEDDALFLEDLEQDQSSPDLNAPMRLGRSSSSRQEIKQKTLKDNKASPSRHPKKKKRVIIDVLDFKNIDILDVLKAIAKKSDANIVAGQNVRGKLTIYLKKVDVRDALRIILEAHGLAYVEEDNIIKVMTDKDFELTYGYKFGDRVNTNVIHLSYLTPKDIAVTLNQMKSSIGKVIADDKSGTIILMDTPTKLDAMESFIFEVDVPDAPVLTEIFELKYTKAEEIAEKISEILTEEVGRIKFDPRSNKVIVTDTQEKIDEIKKLIEAFDGKEKEVLIEAQILQIILSDQHKSGVDWEGLLSEFHTLDLTSNFSVLSATEKRGSISIGTTPEAGDNDYRILLEALETIGETNILSKPRIATLNNQEAKILVGSTEPYITTTTTTPASGPTTTSESVNFIDVGVKLFVTPTINKDGYVTMLIKPEVSSVVRTVTTGNNNTIPVVETSEAETTVMVKDGVTIVIGGLMKDEKIESISKMPLLGDIPLIGLVFRNKDKLIRKTELVIFLTPKIITGDVPWRDYTDFFSNL